MCVGETMALGPLKVLGSSRKKKKRKKSLVK